MSFAPAQPNDNTSPAAASPEVSPVAEAAHNDIGTNYFRTANELDSSGRSGAKDSDTDINNGLNAETTNSLYKSVVTGNPTTDGPTNGPTDAPTDGPPKAPSLEKVAATSRDSAPEAPEAPEAPIRSDRPAPSSRPEMQLARSAGGG